MSRTDGSLASVVSFSQAGTAIGGGLWTSRSTMMATTCVAMLRRGLPPARALRAAPVRCSCQAAPSPLGDEQHQLQEQRARAHDGLQPQVVDDEQRMNADPTQPGCARKPGSRTGESAHASDSAVQLAAEPLMVQAVAAKIGVPLAKTRLPIGDGVECEVDGASADRTVLVEAFAHQGAMRGAQIKKVSEDAFKLVTLAKGHTDMKLILAFADELAARSVLGRSWKAEALRLWGVEVLVVELPDDVRVGIHEAQVRQFR